MLPGHCEVGTEQRRDRDQLPRPARPRPPQRAPHPAYPLGHLMLGGSSRNQGRYLWNCSTVGRTGPSVRLTQLLMQARESVKTAGALGSSSRRAQLAPDAARALTARARAPSRRQKPVCSRALCLSL